MKNIALIGFMGTGKSSIGVKLADILGWNFIDTDKVIEEKTGMDITYIFQEYGEEYFRREEIKTIKAVCQCEKNIIATGGGTVLNETNIACLKEHTFIICLRALPEVILERVRYDNVRPLLAKENPRKIIENLLKIREPYYQCADLYIDTSGKNVEDIIEEILSHLAQRGMPYVKSCKVKG